MVIATVFLTIIGGTFGFMLGERHRGDGGTPTPGNTATSPRDSEPSSSAPSGPPCPAETIQAAASQHLPTDLRQVFKIVTTKSSIVWICEDPAGSLYFQSKTGGVDAPLKQGRNALFLSGVSRVGEDEYEVTAAVDGNSFEVNRQQYVVHFADGRADQVYPVKSVE